MSFENRYGLLERALHRVAFATTTAQLGLADLERRLFARELSEVEPAAPVLVTALPRAGTTILLEMLAATPSFAAQTYRDMPFVLCPLLWSRFTSAFRRADAPRERAHGDGIQISIDSPEAFEEMLWMAFFADHYRGPTLPVWTDCTRRDFVEFFAWHRRKVIALRRRLKRTAGRYVSKNNLDIARIPALWQAVPDAHVVVLVREPLQQAESLHRQHLRFLELHDRDPFARRYMAGIGHFDFGRNLRPIDFGGWHARRATADATELGFWLEYWNVAYGHVLANVDRERLHVVGFERLCDGADLHRLAQCIELDHEELAAQRGRLGRQREHAVDVGLLPGAVVDEARKVYRELVQHSVV
ncbi:MAG: sulfotransferase [Planctomycetes bacterium]|nr:sulfotransferase [Planctomycetota bacterium]